jgi:N-acetylglucosaminyl-diphospho-decaprenol L-rhamnosyltransferase
MTASPKFSVIIVSWNVAGSLHRCLESVARTRYPELEVIVIDNASSDHSVKVVKEFIRRGLPDSHRQAFPVKLIENPGNLGFPRAVNQGLAAATGDYLLLLNPDAALPPAFFVKSAAFFADYPDAAVMGPELVDPDGTVQGSVFPEPSVLDTAREYWFGQKGLTRKYSPPGSAPVAVNSVSGACFLFPRRILQRIGPFTEQVFMYYEDLDYCRRVRAAGWKVYFNPGLRVVHEHGRSSIKTAGLSSGYLSDASRWYNGPVRHWLMWFIIRTSQVFS